MEYADRSPNHFGRRAIIIEAQSLFVPFLVRTLREIGISVLGAGSSPGSRRLGQMRPDVVILDVAHLKTAPLPFIHRLRKKLPRARIVVFSHIDDHAWAAMACAIGADVVLGADAGMDELQAALGERYEAVA